MRLLLTGGAGMLGGAVARRAGTGGAVLYAPPSGEMDITDAGRVRAAFARFRPEAVIHCAAYTRVDRAEDEPERCRLVNAVGTRNIAAACREAGAKLLYVSTDYVFPGTGERFYEPEDPTGPLNVYGRTKLEGELAVRELLERYFIVRTSWVFGEGGNHFIGTMLHLAGTRSEVSVVWDQTGGPTYTADLAPLLLEMAGTDRFGVYHAVNEGTCSWAELARETFRLAGKNVAVRPIASAEYPAKAVRPHNSRLSTAKLAAAGFARLPDWRDALRRYLAGAGFIPSR